MQTLKYIHKCICAASAAAGVPLAHVDSFAEVFEVNQLIRKVGIQHTSEQGACTLYCHFAASSYC